MTIESSDTVHLRASTPPAASKSRRRRRRCCLSCTVCLLFLLALIITVLILAFTLFRPKDPTTHLVSARVTGISPRITFPLVNLQINVTLDLDILVHNPNVAKFTHGLGQTQLSYRGAQVGVADVEPGRIRARGSDHVMLALTVEADRFAAEVGKLMTDVMNGEVGFDASTRIPGRVSILGLFKHHAVAVSECHVVVGFPDLKVKQQDCTQSAKL